MTSFERFVCNRYKAGQLSQAQLDSLLAQGKISQAAYDCTMNPECSCDWSTAAMAAEAEPPAEA